MRVCSCCYNALIDSNNQNSCAIIIPDDYADKFPIHHDHPNDLPWINGNLLEIHFGLRWVSDGAISSRNGWYTPDGQVIAFVYNAKPKDPNHKKINDKPLLGKPDPSVKLVVKARSPFVWKSDKAIFVQMNGSETEVASASDPDVLYGLQHTVQNTLMAIGYKYKNASRYCDEDIYEINFTK